MNSEIQVFNFDQAKLRVEMRGDEPMFCLKDVAEILEIKDHKSRNFNLKDDGVETFPLIDRMGREQEATFINEPNLYRVIFRSNKEEAVKFQDWIFEEVIPQIRKTGGYGTEVEKLKLERLEFDAEKADWLAQTGMSTALMYGLRAENAKLKFELAKAKHGEVLKIERQPSTLSVQQVSMPSEPESIKTFVQAQYEGAVFDLPLDGFSIRAYRLGRTVYLSLKDLCTACGLEWQTQKKRVGYYEARLVDLGKGQMTHCASAREAVSFLEGVGSAKHPERLKTVLNFIEGNIL